jgi:hypothetical protein
LEVGSDLVGDLKNMAKVGTQAKRGKGDVLPPATIVRLNSHIAHDGKKFKGDLVISQKGLEIQGELSAGLGKKTLRRIPLVVWDDVTSIDIDGHGYERQRGRSFISTGGGLGRVGSTHTSAESHLVLRTAKQELAYTLPIDPTKLRNLLGTVTVQIEERASEPPPSPSAAPPPHHLPHRWPMS